MNTTPLYYRRSIGNPTDVTGWVVYALFAEAPTPSPDVLAAVGAFPHGYRPTSQPGQVLRDQNTTMQFWTCDLERTQLWHYHPLTEREAFILYPRLQQYVAGARRSLTDTGDLPLGAAR